ncbi:MULTISPECIES: helix-turn-helix transcriptional regulator [unclassified Microbacterium]|jgi:transcriptional regulator with XRE-family HTH domain|uniref:helix-turn-helix transcriptional regulator n=1 Tax=unclassified Microbacterium TaxID=2609290 RepID=UPI000E73C248|nr:MULTISPECIES: helix-turn-helix transcriptional regulator [unclassified Microbacterium]MDF2563048.1 family transcriptional regulator [Microbacterium sp.]RKE64599.1 helix-turn-helix protein [Microbacterium sp. AG238]
MDTGSELREFLVSRRARITPEQAKLPAYGGNRRVAGLRREEVAILAGVSVDYYTKLERGAVGLVSESVLDAVARALQLTRTERDHLFHLTGTTASLRTVSRPIRSLVRPAVQRILDGLSGESPAFVGTVTRDLIAANTLGRATYSPLYDDAPNDTPNIARYTFLNPGAQEFFIEWGTAAANLVANLRRELGTDPLNRDLQHLIDDLNRDSPEFRALWRSHDVRTHDAGVKSIRHPVVGDLRLTFESIPLPADPGQNLIIYGAEPGSETADRLRLLASWSATSKASDATTWPSPGVTGDSIHP